MRDLLDSRGERSVKNINGVKTHFIFNLQGQLIAEADENDVIEKEYVYANGQPLAQIVGANVYYYHNSHLGTPEVLTDAMQNVVWQASYSPFGKAEVQVETLTNNIRFPGQYFDSETGLHYNYFRDYDPEVGRYIQSDPIGLAGGINTYGYVGANPVNWVDLFGLDRYLYNRTFGRIYYFPGGVSPLPSQSWSATSGPFGNGELPEGLYSMPSPPITVPPSQSAYCDNSGNCWWQPLTPEFPTNRTGLGIHPDGNVEGTLGCVGVTEDDSTSLREHLENHPNRPLIVR